MTPEEIICTFMERRPDFIPEGQSGHVPEHRWAHRWWKWYVKTFDGVLRHEPRDLDLDALRDVQEHLTDEQWEEYEDEIWHTGIKRLLHATPKQKIKALASVLVAPDMEMKQL